MDKFHRMIVSQQYKYYFMNILALLYCILGQMLWASWQSPQKLAEVGNCWVTPANLKSHWDERFSEQIVLSITWLVHVTSRYLWNIYFTIIRKMKKFLIKVNRNKNIPSQIICSHFLQHQSLLLDREKTLNLELGLIMGWTTVVSNQLISEVNT